MWMIDQTLGPLLLNDIITNGQISRDEFLTIRTKAKGKSS